jgi:hypothetical protein
MQNKGGLVTTFLFCMQTAIGQFDISDSEKRKGAPEDAPFPILYLGVI